MTNLYQQPTYDGPAALEDAIEKDDVARLRQMIIGVALHEEDLDTAQAACLRLSKHSDEIVRGNAILGFGHLARIFGKLGNEAMAVIGDGLTDPSQYVRGQAHAAASDVKHFLGVAIDRPT